MLRCLNNTVNVSTADTAFLLPFTARWWDSFFEISRSLSRYVWVDLSFQIKQSAAVAIPGVTRC